MLGNNKNGLTPSNKFNYLRKNMPTERKGLEYKTQ